MSSLPLENVYTCVNDKLLERILVIFVTSDFAKKKKKTNPKKFVTDEPILRIQNGDCYDPSWVFMVRVTISYNERNFF